MLDVLIIQKYVDKEILEIIGGHFSSYVKPFFSVLVKLIVLYFLFYLSYLLFGTTYISKRIIGSIGVWLLIKYCIGFLVNFLSGTVCTPGGLRVFTRSSVVGYKMQSFDWTNVGTITSEQVGIWDKLFNAGTVYVKLRDGLTFNMTEVYEPEKIAQRLTSYKERFSPVFGRQEKEEKGIKEKEKFDALVEALGEIIVKHVEEKKNMYE